MKMSKLTLTLVFKQVHLLFVFIIGFTLWMPSVSLLNIGGGSSIQPVVGIGVLLVALLMHYNMLHLELKFYAWIMIIFFGIVLQFYSKILLSDDLIFYEKGSVFFLLSLFIVFIGAVIVQYKFFTDMFFDGYIAGGIFSSIWAIAQWFFWSILNVDFPLLVGVHNTSSFAKYAVDAKYVELGRGFAFTPEPSILFTLLVPCLALQLYKRGSFLGIITVLAAIFTTNSVGIVLVLPIALIYTYHLKGIINKKAFIVAIIAIITSLGSFMAIAYQNINVTNIANDTAIIYRVQNLSKNVSFISRANSMLVALSMIKERPLLGWGVQSDESVDKLKMNSTIVEENIGIDSFLLSALTWFGVIITVIMFWPTVCLIIQKTNINDPIKLFVFCTVFGSSLSISYFNLYHVWAAIGMSTCIFKSKNEVLS
jgi:hypothetical protein